MRRTKVKLSNVLAASTAVVSNASILDTEAGISANIFEIPFTTFNSNELLLETIIKEHCPSYTVYNNTATPTPIATISDKDFKRAFMNSSEIMTDYATKRNLSPSTSYQEITSYIDKRKLLGGIKFVCSWVISSTNVLDNCKCSSFRFKRFRFNCFITHYGCHGPSTIWSRFIIL